MHRGVPQPTSGESAQPVEAWCGGDWCSGLLIGCRLAPDGIPLARGWLPDPEAVAVWVAFTDLRLPMPSISGRHRAPADAPSAPPLPAGAGPATVRLPLGRVSLPRQPAVPFGEGRRPLEEPLTAPLR